MASSPSCGAGIIQTGDAAPTDDVTARAASSGVTEISNFRLPVTATGWLRFRPRAIKRAASSSVLRGDQRDFAEQATHKFTQLAKIPLAERSDRRALAITKGILRACRRKSYSATVRSMTITSLGRTVFRKRSMAWGDRNGR